MRSHHLLLALASVALSTGAQASGFPQPQGQTMIYSTFVYSLAKKGYDDDGDVIDIPDYRQSNIYVLGEHGLTDDLTLIVAPSYRNIDVEGPGRDTSGLNFIDVGARYRVAQLGQASLSLQGSVRFPGETFRDPLAQVSQAGMEYDLRGQLGTGLGENGAAGFFVAEAGYRFRDDDPPNEVHLDFTLGIRATPRLQFIANSYNTISDGRGRGVFDDYRYHNVYLSGVYAVTPQVSVQLGGHMTLAGENALRERGLLAGLWFRF